MGGCIDLLEEAIVFSTLDANSGYWQIRVDEFDQNKKRLALITDYKALMISLLNCKTHQEPFKGR